MVAPELCDRITGITFDRIKWSGDFEGFSAMRFPSLTWLSLTRGPVPVSPIFPESFLGGSAPELRSFKSYNIGFTTFPKLALSATRLVTLSLLALHPNPSNDSLTPEGIVSNLSALPTLIELAIGYERRQYPEDRPGLRDPHHQTPIVLPALTHFRFEGDDDYLEYFVSQIDAPLLNEINILFLDYVPHHVQQLDRLISGAESFEPPKQATIDIHLMRITLQSPTHFLVIRTERSFDPVRSMTRLCSDLSHLLSIVDDLEIRGYPSSRGDYADKNWLKLLRPFIAVQSLYATNLIARLIAPVLQKPTRPSDTLPSLRNIVLERCHPSKSDVLYPY